MKCEVGSVKGEMKHQPLGGWVGFLTSHFFLLTFLDVPQGRDVLFFLTRDTRDEC